MIIVVSFTLLCLLATVLAWIDIRHGIIPDWLNLAIAGLDCRGPCWPVALGRRGSPLRGRGDWPYIPAPETALFRLEKNQGLGLGDVKFLAAAGTWSASPAFPCFLLVAALTALACAGVMRLAGRQMTAQTSDVVWTASGDRSAVHVSLFNNIGHVAER